MRIINIGIFVIGAVSFLTSIFFIGDPFGDTLWRAGVAAMLMNLAVNRLWQTS